MDTVGMFKNKTVCFSGRFNEFVRADAEIKNNDKTKV